MNWPDKEAPDQEGLNGLWSLWHQERSADVRARLVDAYLPWVKAVAVKCRRTYTSNLYDLNDYVHFGILGLLQCIENFDSTHRVKFETYSYLRIKGSILDGVGNGRKEPVHMYESVDSMLNEHEGREDVIGIEEWINVIADLAMVKVVDITCGRPSSGPTDPLDIYINQRQEENLWNLIGDLNEVMRFVIESRYKRNLTFVQIAEVLNLSRSRISQIHREAMIILRNKYLTWHQE